MYELSLLGFVEDKDVDRAVNVLSGVCAQTPWEALYHVCYYRGPGRPSGMANPAPTPTSLQKDVPALWKELDRALSRQSYHVQVRHEVSKADLGKQEPTDLDADPAVLRWVDFPEPAQAVVGVEKGAVTQRKKVEIWAQKNLHSLVKGKGYSLTSDQLEHAYLFFRDDIEICVHRLLLPIKASEVPNPDLNEHGIQTDMLDVSLGDNQNKDEPGVAPTNPLPSLENFANVDDMDQWMVVIKTHVLQDNKPDEVRKAQEQLVALKNELEGVFQFEVIERQFLDTRVPLAVQSTMAPLPQVQKAGD